MELENSSRFTDIVNSIRDAVEAGSITNDMIAEAFDIIRRGLETSADSSDIQEALEQAFASDDFIGSITVSELNSLSQDDLVKYAYSHLSGKHNYLHLVSDFDPDLHLGTVQIVGNLSCKALDILCFTALKLDAEGNLNPSASDMYRSHIYRRNIYGGDDSLQVSPWVDISISTRTMGIDSLERLTLDQLAEYASGGESPYLQISGFGLENIGTAQIFLQSNDPLKYCIVFHTTFMPTNGAYTDKGQYVKNKSEVLHTYYCFIYENILNAVTGRDRTNWTDRVDTLETKVNNKVDKVDGKGLSTNDFTSGYKNYLSDLFGVFNDITTPSGPSHLGVITWNSSSHVNNYCYKGTWRIKGERTNNADGLPIGNVGSGHTLDGILYVFDSSLTSGSDSNYTRTVTQLLVLSNRKGGQEGGQWIRSGYGVNTSSLTWDPWAKMQTNMEVGVVNDTMQLMDSAGNQTLNASLGMDSLVDNGIYSGVYLPNNGTSVGADAETFVMVVINNYAVAGEYKSICQIKLGLETKGEFQFKRRLKLSGSWTAWTAVATGGGSSIISDYDFGDLTSFDGFLTAAQNLLSSQSVGAVITGTSIAPTVDQGVTPVCKTMARIISDACVEFEIDISVGSSTRGICVCKVARAATTIGTLKVVDCTIDCGESGGTDYPYITTLMQRFCERFPDIYLCTIRGNYFYADIAEKFICQIANSPTLNDLNFYLERIGGSSSMYVQRYVCNRNADTGEWYVKNL